MYKPQKLFNEVQNWSHVLFGVDEKNQKCDRKEEALYLIKTKDFSSYVQ